MTESLAYDKLFAGNVQPVVTEKAVVVSGAGSLVGGTVLGAATRAKGTIVAGTNTGDGTIASFEMLNTAIIGAYKATCITAPTTSGANNAKFSVITPSGVRLADATQAVAYSNHLAFTITNRTSTDFAVGDSFTINVVAGSGKLKKIVSTAVDGSDIPYGVLCDAVDATSADKVASVYLTGEFNEAALVFGGSDTAATHKTGLRRIGIFLKPTISA